MLEIEVGEDLLIGAVARTGAAGLFPQLELYDQLGALVGGSAINISSDLGKGMYLEVFSGLPALEAQYQGILTFYDDAAHTTPTAGEERQTFGVRVVLPSPSVAQVNFAYDEEGEQLFAEAWLERKGGVVLTPSSAVVALRDKDGAIIANLSSSSPDANNGVFNMEQAGVILADNRPYNALVTVSDAISSVQTVHSLSTVA